MLQSRGKKSTIGHMRVLFLGEIVGRCGIGIIKNALRDYRKENGIDLVVANGEGATGGFGLGFQNALTLQHMGIDVLTLGEKAFYKIDMVEGIAKRDRILRPSNYPESVPGRGVRYISVGDRKVCMINSLGMCNFNSPHLNNPFLNADSIVDKAREETPFVFYMFHSSATAEKMAMGFMLDGKASAVVGTHCKVLTSDSRILPKGTAYVTDLGRCGASMSVGGFDPSFEIKRIRTQVLVRSKESWCMPQMQGIVCTFDDASGLAVEVSPVRLDVDVVMPPPKDEGKD